MKSGIVSCGVYVPWQRLPRELLAKAWGGGGLKGEKAVGNHDEDSLTMAVEASLNALEGRDPSKIDGVFFASASPPYKEKLSAATLATALDFPPSVETADVTGSTRSGAMALKAALDAVESGRMREALVAVGEARPAAPESEVEPHLGEGGGALIVGSDGVGVEIQGHHSLTSEFMDRWRRDEDAYVQTGDERFSGLYGYGKVLPQVLRGLGGKTGRKIGDYARALLPAPDARSLLGVVRATGLNPEGQVQDPLYLQVGDAGSALPFLLLGRALQDWKPGERILWTAYGDGADAFDLVATAKVEGARPRPTLQAYLNRKHALTSYERWLKFRRVLGDPTYDPPSSAILFWKELPQGIRLRGTRCRKCATVQYPDSRLCPKCGSKDASEEVRLARRGKVFTFTRDHLFQSAGGPIAMAVVDLEGGGRILLQAADCDPDDVKVGLDVELVFRRIHEGGEFHNYYWKARPVRA